MIGFILKRLFGTQNERYLRRVQVIVDRINELEKDVCGLSDAELRAKTNEFRKRIAKRSKEVSIQQAMDEVLPEAFAVVREAGKRYVNMRHFDVQLIGGIVLHQGKIAEMATGEGKTLVATLAVYLNVLGGYSVHVVTVNDYLARRDRNWMRPIYENLGLSVGVIQHDMPLDERKKAYQCDVVYGTNNEFGFDYLRDNMVMHKDELVQRSLDFAIVDEVDSILIDEARTPLIISGPAEESTQLYYKIDKLIPKLKRGVRDEETKTETGDFIVDEKMRNVYLTEEGEAKVTELLGIKDMHSIEFMEYKHHINQALRAHYLYKRDVDYIVKDGQVVIVDEFTGRLMPGRRWSDGLHQAVEAKEGVRIERENQTLATVTLQNYFRMYRKLAGMTGTAETEAMEFKKIYNLDVVVIPTNKPLIRTSYPDVIYKTQREKFKAVCDEIEELHRKGRPVLVGTISIENNERLSQMLKRRNIPHYVLNAKYHELEAHIIAQAGRVGAVTIATNMAGRGTDILLGGNPEFLAKDMVAKLTASGKDVTPEEESRIYQQMKQKTEQEHKKVVELGGLHVLGTERHEARRIDNQLRGRAGRQGDPGSSRFYLSLEDDLLRIFGSDRISRIMTALKMEEGQDIQHPMITKSIEIAQKRVEEHNFGVRKHLLEYDNVMNTQREIVYKERRHILRSQDLTEYIYDIIEDVVDIQLELYLSKDLKPHEWDLSGFKDELRVKFLLQVDDLNLEDMSYEEIRQNVILRFKDQYNKKMQLLGRENMTELGRMILLHIIDSKWKDHLYNMDNLREGISLRAYGQRDPLIEYQHEGYQMFRDMLANIKEETLEFLFKVREITQPQRLGVFDISESQFLHEEKESFSDLHPREQIPESAFTQTDGYGDFVQSGRARSKTYRRPTPKIGRNDPCPCGSGKKYKKCCGK